MDTRAALTSQGWLGSVFLRLGLRGFGGGSLRVPRTAFVPDTLVIYNLKSACRDGVANS